MNRITKLLVCLVMGLFCLAFPKSVLAESVNIPDGFLIGDDQGISVTKDGGYFFNLENLMPGDTITRKLIIQNKRAADYHLKMVITPKSHEGPVNLIESIEMTFTQNDRFIYEGNLSSDKNGKTAETTEVDFGTIAAGTEQTITIDLEVLKNIPFDEFMSGPSKAVVTWTFVADDETEPVKPDEPVKPKGSLPNTGEQRAKILFILGGILLIVTGVLCYVFYYKDKASSN